MRKVYYQGKVLAEGRPLKIVNNKLLIKGLLKHDGKIANFYKECSGLNSVNTFRKLLKGYPIVEKIKKRNKKKRSEYETNGYILENYEFKHRLVMENKLGRKLKENELVHHINLDKKDNRVDNLYLCESISQHRKIHAQLENLAGKLVQMGIIDFCHKTEEYVYTHTYKDKILG